MRPVFGQMKISVCVCAVCVCVSFVCFALVMKRKIANKMVMVVWVAEWQQQLGLHSLVTNCP